ncbi:MAG: Type 1 glutamine amidotransferase-like domain-containing protein [Anaerolineae bacterium]|nr:Type 1 glutamine amidotransferase-like domain-containing protein [Anaerolineae bacterium]
MRLALIGGEEFAPGFEDVHADILSSVAGGQSRGVFLPTCAAHDGIDTVQYWCDKAQHNLSPFAGMVATPLVIDKPSANDPTNAGLIANADWVYLGGGFPHVGMTVLSSTAVLRELRRVAERGVLILGASAGAMMMCGESFVITPDLFGGKVKPEPIDGLGFIPNSLCIPHFNRSYLQHWTNDEVRPPNTTLIGINEQTALVNLHGYWEVLGRGTVAIFECGSAITRYQAGQRVTLPARSC